MSGSGRTGRSAMPSSARRWPCHPQSGAGQDEWSGAGREDGGWVCRACPRVLAPSRHAAAPVGRKGLMSMEARERTAGEDVAEIEPLRAMELAPDRPPFLMIDKVGDVVAG